MMIMGVAWRWLDFLHYEGMLDASVGFCTVPKYDRGFVLGTVKTRYLRNALQEPSFEKEDDSYEPRF